MRRKKLSDGELLDYLLSRTVAHPDTGCWIWEGADSGSPRPGATGRGYPRMWYAGRAMQVTRVVMMLVTGQSIPRKKQVDHVRARGCMFRRCIRPDHLEIVTHKQNCRRRDYWA